ncbi:MAG: polysaccharide deacetylase family protein [Gemmatimonadota bacterium]
MTRLRKAARAGYDLTRGVALGRYPAFVYGRGLAADEIPCFCFHGVEPEPFEALLHELRSNEYRTLGIDAFADILTGTRKKEHPRSILLTFDDGVGSMWTTAYPLLKRYGMRGTVFLVPGRIRQRDGYLPNLEDVWAGRAERSDIEGRDAGPWPFATWEEIETMHDSGCMDFESHSHDHSLVFVSPRIVDFVNPAALGGYHRFEFPRIRTGPDRVEDIDQLGAPLYEARPRLGEARRYIDDPKVRDRCVQYVREHGGAAFFERRDWRKQLIGVVRDYEAENGGFDDGYETPDERRAAIRLELHRSRRVMDERIPGKETRHLCYPWGIGSALAEEVAREEGYRTGFWDPPDGSKTVRIGQDPHRIGRLGPDFLPLLPGPRRIGLGRMLVRKVRARLRHGSPYLSH